MHNNEENDQGDDVFNQEIPVEDLEVAHVSKTDLKKLLLDFQIQCGEAAQTHHVLTELKPGVRLPDDLVNHALQTILENQTLIMTGLASLVQIQVNHKDHFGEK